MPASPRPFDPAARGTPEHRWRRSLRRAPAWRPRTPHVTVLSPHPDDEVLGVGGLMGTLAREGTGITVVSVTDGERAYRGVTGLAGIRRQELRRALDTLADGIEVRHLGLPDGGVTRDEAALEHALRCWLRADTTVLAPFEGDGHPDHEATGRVALRLGLPVARYPIWFWHRQACDRVGTLDLRRFEISAAMQRAKARAVARFRSQISPPGRAPILPHHVLEHFRRPYEALVCS